MKRYILFGLSFLLSLFLIVGCGNKVDNSNVTNNNLDNTSNNITDNNDRTSSTSKDEEIELYSDDTKIVFANAGGRIVYYYEGDTITGYRVYLDYGDNATAKFALANLDWQEDETIKNAFAEGKYVVVEYSESEYENQTVTDVRALYSYLEEIQKNN